MKSNEILQALSLEKCKGAIAYCSKLANLFTFLKLIISGVFKAVISSTGCTIDKDGKLMDIVQLEIKYKENRLYHYRYNDNEMVKLIKEENELGCQFRHTTDELWKKRKNKDNSQLEIRKDNLTEQLKCIEDKKETLIDAENIRLQDVITDIQVMRDALNLLSGNLISVVTDTGSYTFYLPTNNVFYYTVCKMLNFDFEVAENKKEVTVLNTIAVDSRIFAALSKAVRFISDEDLRPAMQHVLLDFENYGCEVVATDAFRLYLSQKFEGSEKSRVQILISEQTAKKLSKIKFDDAMVELSVLDNDMIMINGDTYPTFKGHFPDYRCVMPKYKQFMEFDVAPFVANIKKVMPCVNKSTNQVNFHLNGSISLHTQDVDFSFECDADMPYISKSFPDTDMAFNGKLLLDSLCVFKDKTLKFKTDGISTKAGIFTNDTDTVLLMPVLMND